MQINQIRPTIQFSTCSLPATPSNIDAWHVRQFDQLYNVECRSNEEGNRMRKLMLGIAAAATLLCAALLPSTRAEAMPIGAASSVQAAVQGIAPVQNVWWYGGGWGYGWGYGWGGCGYGCAPRCVSRCYRVRRCYRRRCCW